MLTRSLTFNTPCKWLEIPDDARYGMLENELNSALRERIKAVARRNKIQMDGAHAHVWKEAYEPPDSVVVLRPHIAGGNTFEIIDLTKMSSIDRFTHGSEPERLEAFVDR